MSFTHALRAYLRIAIFLVAIIRCVGLYASGTLLWSDTMHIADIHACAHIVATDPESGQWFGAVDCIDACITE